MFVTLLEFSQDLKLETLREGCHGSPALVFVCVCVLKYYLNDM